MELLIRINNIKGFTKTKLLKPEFPSLTSYLLKTTIIKIVTKNSDENILQIDFMDGFNKELKNMVKYFSESILKAQKLKKFKQLDHLRKLLE
jgi:hypothetical protein